MDRPVDRRLIQAPFAADLACLFGLAPPLGLGPFGQSFFEGEAVLFRADDSTRATGHSGGRIG